MVTDTTRKHREIFAYGLLGVAGLYVISGLALLFKSGDDLRGASFSDKAALFGYLFSNPLLLVSLVGAVILVTAWGEKSPNAKTVVTAALGIAGLAFLLGLICWLAAFGSDQGNGISFFNGVFFAGKVVGIFLGIAQLGLLGLVAFYAFSVFQTFPKAAPAQQPAGWGQQQGQWGQQGYYDQGQQGQQGQPGQQAQWGQPQGSYDQGQQGQAWGQQGQAWGQQGSYDQGQQGSYDQGQQQAQAWGTGTPGGWGDQSAAQAEQQGQPAATWGQPDQPSGWTQGDQPQQSWDAPATEPEAQQSPEQPYAAPSHSAAPAADETQVWSGQPEATDPSDGATPASRPDDEPTDGDDSPPPQQGWWQQPRQ